MRYASGALLALALLVPTFSSAQQPPQQCERHSDCDDQNDCSSDLCINGRCENPPLDTPCDDRNECTTDSCDPVGGCTNTPTTCDDSNACTTDTCDKDLGCQYAPMDMACDDSVECTTDTCDPEAGCQHTPVDSACDDSNACTVGTCDVERGCEYKMTSEKVCDDDNPCTSDACDQQTGKCAFVPMDGGACDSGQMCGSGMCEGGECIAVGPNPEDMGHHCGDVPAVGRCDGHVLKTCVSGEVKIENCAAASRVCAWDEEGWDGWGAFECVSHDDDHVPCANIPDAGKCVGSKLYWCDTDTGETHVYDCATDGSSCGWGGGFFCCQDVRVCVPLCQGKQCGDDGCGGSCGECDGLCAPSGHCLPCEAQEPEQPGNGPESNPNGDGDNYPTDSDSSGSGASDSDASDKEKKPIGCTSAAVPGGGSGAAIFFMFGLIALAIQRRRTA